MNGFNFLKKELETLNNCNKVPGFLPFMCGISLYLMAKNHLVKGVFVEIGSFKGRSTCFIASGLKNNVLYAIDHHKGSPEHQKGQKFEKTFNGNTFEEFKKNIDILGLKNVIPIIKSSEEAVKDWKLPISFIFIDGDHSYESVKKDYELWSPFVVNNGVIAFDDSTGGWTGPTRLANELSETFKNIKIGSITYFLKEKKGVENNGKINEN